MAKDEDKFRFRALWSNFPTGVSVISFFTPDGAIHGITANSVCSVSLDPLLVLVCVDHKARSFPMLDASDHFVMNFLAQGQEDQSNFFASSKTEGAGPFTWGRTASGLPTLDGAIGFLDCAVDAKHEAGDHTIFVGRVDEISLREGVEPMAYSHGKYTKVVKPAV